MQTILLTSIIEGVRARKDYGDLDGLKDSLTRLGSIHPIVLSKNQDNTYNLVAGGRRFRSMQQMGVKELYQGSVLEPERFGFLFKHEVPEDELKEAELDENLYRLKPKWQEDALLIADVHELKRRKHGANKWGQRQTADLLSKGGKGFGKSSVNLALKVAELLRKGDKEIMACDCLDDANTIRIKRAEDSALARLSSMAMPVSTATPLPSTPTLLDSFNMDLSTELLNRFWGSNVVSDAKPSAPTLQSAPLTTAPRVRIPLSEMFIQADFQTDTHTAPWVHHIVTDIPYGIDMDNLNQKSIGDVKDEHDVEANLDLMPKFLKFAYDAVKPQGFCVFFYDLDHHEKLQTWAKEVGWRVQRWPLVWNKTHTCQNNAAQYNTTKNFEVAMVLRKDDHTVLRSAQGSSVWTGDGSAERRLYNNPFAKPFELWKWLYTMITIPGQSVLDPFCGEMSACRAAANCGLVPYGYEINPKHYNRGVEHMKAVYALIHKSNVEFI